jgi:hypothetical protein
MLACMWVRASTCVCIFTLLFLTDRSRFFVLPHLPGMTLGGGDGIDPLTVATVAPVRAHARASRRFCFCASQCLAFVRTRMLS